MQPEDDPENSPSGKAAPAGATPTKPAKQEATAPSNPVKPNPPAKPSGPTKAQPAAEPEGGTKPQMLIQEGTAPKAAGWKNLPAKDEWCPAGLAARFPELGIHTYDDNACTDRILATGWRVVGATRRGKQHAHQGTHREDAIRFRSGPNYTILCVADGAGSAKWSRLGSHLASLRVTDSISQQIERIDAALEEAPDQLAAHLKTQMSKAVSLACVALQEAALICGGAPKDFRCTLLTVVCFHGKKGDILLSNQIGDGAIAVLFKDKTTQLFGASDSGAFSGEVACFVPDDCCRLKSEQIDVLPPSDKIECILLCTDGVEDPFYPLQKKSIDLFGQLYGGVKEKLPDFTAQPTQPSLLNQEGAGWALAEWLGFEKRGENDDRSLLLMHRFPSTVVF